MTCDLIEILESVDHKNAEWPPGFNREALLRRIRALSPSLDAISGRRFELDDHAQDASFCADLWIQRPSTKPNRIDVVFALRFSNFGDLFTVWSHCEAERLPDAAQARLIEETARAGFRFVPKEVLERAYSGPCSFARAATWGERYFDYL